MSSNSRLIFTVLLVLYVLQLAYYWPLMPVQMASHFDGAGRPNGWQSRTAFFGITAMVAAVVVFSFRILPKLLRRIPTTLINLPNKDIWLAPEHREATFAELEDHLITFGSATLVLMFAVMQLAFRANLDNDHRMSAAWMIGALVAYVLFTLLWIIRLLLRFRRPAGR